MKQLIINADDFGLHPLINKGIIKGHSEGIITSTSLMPSAPYFDEAVQLAKANPSLGVGIHLTLVGGVKPACTSGVNSLLTADGVFAEDYTVFAKKWYTGSIKKNELVKELETQIEKVLIAGIKPTHIDSHQHMHVLPGIAGIVVRLCEKYGIKKIRMPGENIFWSGGRNAGKRQSPKRGACLPAALFWHAGGRQFKCRTCKKHFAEPAGRHKRNYDAPGA